MRQTPNYHENYMDFGAYIEALNKLLLYMEQGADKKYPGPYGAQEDYTIKLGTTIDRKAKDMISDFREGNIHVSLYKDYLLRYKQLFATINDHVTPGINRPFIENEISKYLK